MTQGWQERDEPGGRAEPPEVVDLGAGDDPLERPAERAPRPPLVTTAGLATAGAVLAVVAVLGGGVGGGVDLLGFYGLSEGDSLLPQYLRQATSQLTLAVLALLVGGAARARATVLDPGWVRVLVTATLVVAVSVLVVVGVGALVVDSVEVPEGF